MKEETPIEKGQVFNVKDTFTLKLVNNDIHIYMSLINSYNTKILIGILLFKDISWFGLHNQFAATPITVAIDKIVYLETVNNLNYFGFKQFTDKADEFKSLSSSEQEDVLDTFFTLKGEVEQFKASEYTHG